MNKYSGLKFSVNSKNMKAMNSKKIITTAIGGLLLCTPLYSQPLAEEISDSIKSTGDQILIDTVANNPNSKIAKLCCARVYIKHGQYDEAEELVKSVLNQTPNYKQAQKLLEDLKTLRQVKENDAYSEPTVIYSETQNTDSTQAEDVTNTNDSEIVNEEIKNIESSTEVAEEITQMPPSSEPVQGDFKVVSETTKTEELSQPEQNSIEKHDIYVIGGDEEENNEETEPEIDATAPKTDSIDVYSYKNTDSDKIAEAAKPSITKDSDKIEDFNLINEEDTSTSKENTEEKMVFTPYIAGDQNLHARDHNGSYRTNEKYDSNKIKTPSDVSKASFLGMTVKSFNINLDEAISRIENNDLDGAEHLLDIASILSIDNPSEKKLSDVQLMRSVLYVYHCDFDGFGKHIFNLRGGIPEDIYKQLCTIYDEGSHKVTKNEQLMFAATTALNSGHYGPAYDLASQVEPQDYESEQLRTVARQGLESADGEYLLTKGSFMNALRYFDKLKNYAEMGRTYLAISKNLEEAGEDYYSALAEKFGETCLIKCLAKDDNDAKANLYLALYYYDKNRKTQAKEAIKRGLASTNAEDQVRQRLLSLSEIM